MANTLFNKLGGVLIWSGNSAQLVKWYKTVFEFEIIEELNHPKDTGTLFKIGENYLWIGQHSGVTGKNPNMYRHMFNLSVDSVSKAYTHLKEKGVEFIAEPFESPAEKDLYFATLKDSEDNIIQLVGGK
jgi:uncharacterized glyoxalase superfamily protein PhnB